MGYTSWNMRPLGPLQAELTLQCAVYEVRFVITEQGLCLKSPDLPEFASIMWVSGLDKDNPLPTHERERLVLSPAMLLWRLRECGMNLMPEDSDADYLMGGCGENGAYVPKDADTEARAYSDLSDIACCFDIASSIHNKTLPDKTALVRIRENGHYEEYDPLDPDSETDYKSVMFFPDKCCFVESIESMKPCNTEMSPEHCTHGSFYLSVQKAPKEGPAGFPNAEDLLQKFEVTCGNVRFTEAVRQTMQLTRLLSFV